MRVKFNEGKTIEEVFGFEENYAKKMIEYVLEILEKGVEIKDAVEMIYKRAKNSKEVGYMLVYYTAFTFADGFSDFMDEVSEEEKYVCDDSGMYW